MRTLIVALTLLGVTLSIHRAKPIKEDPRAKYCASEKKESEQMYNDCLTLVERE